MSMEGAEGAINDPRQPAVFSQAIAHMIVTRAEVEAFGERLLELDPTPFTTVAGIPVLVDPELPQDVMELRLGRSRYRFRLNGVVPPLASQEEPGPQPERESVLAGLVALKGVLQQEGWKASVTVVEDAIRALAFLEHDHAILLNRVRSLLAAPLPSPGERERIAAMLTKRLAAVMESDDRLGLVPLLLKYEVVKEIVAALRREPVPLDRWVLGKQGDTGMFYYVMCGDVIESIHHSLQAARRALAGEVAAPLDTPKPHPAIVSYLDEIAREDQRAAAPREEREKNTVEDTEVQHG